MKVINEIKKRIEVKIKKLDGSFRDEYMEIGALHDALDIIDEVYEEYYTTEYKEDDGAFFEDVFYENGKSE